MSLANRISLVAVLLIAVFGALAGMALYDKVRRAAEDDIEKEQHARLAWMESSLEFDEDNLEFDPKNVPTGAAEVWQISTADGRVLWKSPPDADLDAARLSTKTRRLTLGDKDDPIVPSAKLKADDPNEVDYIVYQRPDGDYRADLVLAARVPADAMYSELQRLQFALLATIPLGVAILAALLTWFVRHQLKPLEAMARASATISPADTTARIDVGSKAKEIVQLRDALNGMIARLGEGLDRERRFASFAAHEMRTPLAQLRANIEVTLRRERSSGDYRKSLDEALLDIDRLQKLVTELLALTRAEENISAADSRATLDQIVSKAAKAVGQDIQAPANANGAVIRGKEELLVAAVRNVFENAARYAPGTAPEVAVLANGDGVNLEIADSGPGVPENERERIFEPLARVDTARSITDEAGGFGLGLAVARAAVRACGGELSCTTRADGKSGARFVFVFKKG